MNFSLPNELSKHGISLSDDALAQFEAYYQMLIEWNERINLTAITKYDDVMEKHFYDSITPAFYQDFNHVQQLIDIGAGAGFPSLPIKIVYPHIQVTIVDSLQKRINFLEQLCKSLGLTGVSLIHGRAEEVAQQHMHREKYPLVLARAVARLPVLLELCLPFLETGGTFIALKGSSGDEEIQESKHALATLGGEFIRKESLHLPNEESMRTLYWIHKIKKTPKQYPRKAGTPNKTPL